MVLLASQGIIVIISIAVFFIVIMTLVMVLLYAKSKLTPQGKVKLKINEDKEMDIDPGSTLLSSLNEKKIYLPSACAGGGTCGMCKCRIVEGGGEILPTEKPFFSRKEQQKDWRLACQVKVRNDMELIVPPEVLDVKKWECEVVSNRNVSTFIKEFVVKLPEGEDLNFKPGGYIQVDVPATKIEFKDIDVEEEFRGEWDDFGLWDLKMVNPEPTYRAYSMANHPAEGSIIKLNVRIATPPWNSSKKTFKKVNPGICSSYIFSRKPGDNVTISGPYGEFFIKDTEKEMIYIGGGAGMAPLRSHIFHLFHTLKTKRKVSYWYGARSKREIFYEEDFKKIEKEFPNFSFKIALSEPKPEDNWDGPVGFIHNVVYEEYLKNLEEPDEIEYYFCGPPMMNDAVSKMLYDLGIPEEMISFDDFGN